MNCLQFFIYNCWIVVSHKSAKKSQGKRSFILQTADMCDFFGSNKSRQVCGFHYTSKRLQGAKAPTLQPGPLSFAYCSINTVLLVYHFWHLCDRLIVLIRSGKLSFLDWKSRRILLQKTCRKMQCQIVLLSYTLLLCNKNLELDGNSINY